MSIVFTPVKSLTPADLDKFEVNEWIDPDSLIMYRTITSPVGINIDPHEAGELLFQLMGLGKAKTFEEKMIDVKAIRPKHGLASAKS